MMPPARSQLMIPLFDRKLHHSFVPTRHEPAIARSGSPGRPLGRRVSALPWTVASTVAGWCRFGTALGFAAILASLATAANGATTARTPVTSETSTANSHNNPFASFIDEAAQRFRFPALWIRAVMQVESNDNPAAVSPKGAMGLMQIMPQTWAELRQRYSLGADPFDPRDNIMAGAAYLRELCNRFGTDGFFAAYNSGPTRFEAYQAGFQPLRDETRQYLAKLQAMLPALRIGDTADAVTTAMDWRKAGLFPTSTAAGSSPMNGSSNQTVVTGSLPVLFALASQAHGLFVTIRTRLK